MEKEVHDKLLSKESNEMSDENVGGNTVGKRYESSRYRWVVVFVLAMAAMLPVLA